MPQTDQFQFDTATSPAKNWMMVVPHATEEQPILFKSIVCQQTGSITCRDRGNREVSFPATAGQILPIRPFMITAMTGAFIGLF